MSCRRRRRRPEARPPRLLLLLLLARESGQEPVGATATPTATAAATVAERVPPEGMTELQLLSARRAGLFAAAGRLDHRRCRGRSRRGHMGRFRRRRRYRCRLCLYRQSPTPSRWVYRRARRTCSRALARLLESGAWTRRFPTGGGVTKPVPSLLPPPRQPQPSPARPAALVLTGGPSPPPRAASYHQVARQQASGKLPRRRWESQD